MRLFRLPFAVALTAVAVSTGLVVQSSSPAAALDVGPIVKTGLKKGVPIGKGASLFGRFSNPAGIAITVGQLAWWGYSERDSIMDFVNPPVQVGTDPDGWSSPAADSVMTYSLDMEFPNSRYVVAAVSCNLVVPYTGISGYMRCSGSSSTAGFTSTGTTVHEAACRKITTGEITIRTFSFSAVFGSPWAPSSTHPGTEDARVAACATGEIVLGARVGPSTNGLGAAQRVGVSTGSMDGLPSGDMYPGGATVTARCKNVETGATQTLVSVQDLDSHEVVLPSCKQRLGDDWYGTGVTIAPTKPEIDNEPIPDEIEVPDFVPFDWDELLPDPTDDEDWQPCLGSKKGCTLDVWIDDKPCDETRPICKKWTTVKEMDPDRVKCRYGSKVVDAKFCIPLTEIYRPDVEVGTGTKTDAPPTGDGPVDVGTGQPRPPTLKDPESETQKGECFPSGWGLMNPVEWVFKPVKCALQWAFVPKTPFSTRLERMALKLNGRAPFSWFQSLTSLPTSLPGGGGCPDWRIKVGNVDQNIICNTGFGNAMRAARPVFTVLMIGAMFYPMIRSVLYSAFPLIKPTPVSS